MIASRLHTLTRPAIIWANFLATLALTAVFALVMFVWDFEIIDEMYDASQILDHVAAMSPTQKTVHIWLTATVDVIYPFTYGAFFIGVALKAFEKYGLLLATPSLLVIPVDLFEGFTQVMLLSGSDGFVDAKTIATPTKLALFLFGTFVTLLGLARMYLRQRQAS